MRSVLARPWQTSGVTEPAWAPVALEDLGRAMGWIDAERENVVAVATAVDEPASRRRAGSGGAAAARQPRLAYGSTAIGLIAVEAAQRAAEPSLVATARCAFGTGLIATSPADAVKPLQAARDWFATVDGCLQEAGVRTFLSHALVMVGRAPEAEDELMRAIGLHRAFGEDELEAFSLTHLGIVLQHQDRYDEARQRHEEALELRRGLGDTRGMGISLANLGQLAMVVDQPTPSCRAPHPQPRPARSLAEPVGRRASALGPRYGVPAAWSGGSRGGRAGAVLDHPGRARPAHHRPGDRTPGGTRPTHARAVPTLRLT